MLPFYNDFTKPKFKSSANFWTKNKSTLNKGEFVLNLHISFHFWFKILLATLAEETPLLL
jgi:hypothetical protein